MLTFSLDDKELEIEFNFKIPSTITYERNGGKESFYGFWMSTSWSDDALSTPDALGTDKFIDISVDGIVFTNDNTKTFTWEDT
jgi:hypothetical protein